MLLTLMKAKIHRCHLTGTELLYEGSLTLDPVLMDRAGLLAGEQVQVVNLNNGERLETYLIRGRRPGSGEVVLNGPAARKGYVGDQVIVIAYAHFTPEEAAAHRPRVVQVDADNRPLSE